MARSVGRPMNRVDGKLKVTGRARYTTDHPVPNVAHAVLVVSSIAKGRIPSIDTRAAARVPGVLAVLTPQNAPRLTTKVNEPDTVGLSGRVLQLLQDDRVRYANQPVAVVVGETLEAAQEGAAVLKVPYLPQQPEVRLDAQLPSSYIPKHAARPDQPTDHKEGNVAIGLFEADVRLEHVYRTPFETHNPMEPHATIAIWDGPERLTLYDTTQGIFGCRKRVAAVLGLRPENVRVISEYLGGGFGSKGPTWSHVVLAAMAAQRVNRPVKLALTRPQMAGPIGFRSRTRQAIAVGTKRDGSLTALRHDTVAQTSSFDEFMEPASVPTRMLYACPNIATSHRLVRSDIGTPSYTRAPGWAPGTFALECAIDEIAYAIEMDPLAFRLKNYAEQDPEKHRPWSLKSLRECYRVGAERFGWRRRPFAAGSLREGPIRIGWGMATSVYPAHRSAASAVARLFSDGTIRIESGTQDIGTGTYTVMTQIAADAIGVPPEHVSFHLGDTEFPETPVSGGSQTAASTGSAVRQAGLALRENIVHLAVGDPQSPVAGVNPRTVVLEDGRVFRRGAAARGETLRALMARHRGVSLEARADSKPGDEHDRYAMYGFGAEFVEVRVDTDLGRVRVSRMVGVFDPGRILNPKTAHSQFIGGMIWGIGMALYEETVMDTRLGRPVNNNFAEYHIPVQADVPAIDVSWIDESDDRANPIGVKGIGELPITGTAAAIANAVYHATGKRVRDLPITLDKVL